jgi:protein NrfD
MSMEAIRYRSDRRLDFRLALGVAAMAMMLGAIGVFRVLVVGDHGNLTSYVPWGLWVGVYVYLVWLEVGMILSYFVLKHIFRVPGIEKLGPLILMAALAALLGALFIIGMDLGHPFRAWKAFLYPTSSSLMTWMIWLHSFYLVLLVIEVWAYHNNYQELIRWLNWVNIPAGVALISVIGGLFGVIAARPFWNASALPLAFFSSSLVAGTGLICLLHLLFSPAAGRAEYRETAGELGRIFTWAILLGLVVASANLLVIAYPNVPARMQGLRLALFGPYWWTLWIIHIGMGALVPLALLTLFRRSLLAIGAAAALMVASFSMVPINIIVPGLAYPPAELAGLASAYVDARLHFQYFPNLTEWLVALFAFGTALAVFSVGYRVLLDGYYRALARGDDPHAPTPEPEPVQLDEIEELLASPV